MPNVAQPIAKPAVNINRDTLIPYVWGLTSIFQTAIINRLYASRERHKANSFLSGIVVKTEKNVCKVIVLKKIRDLKNEMLG